MRVAPAAVTVETPAVVLFKSSFRSPATRVTYLNILSLFCKHVNLTPDQLLRQNKKTLEDLIIAFINKSKQENRSYSLINNQRCCLVRFCKVHGKKLDWERICQFLPEQTKPHTDRPYKKEELQKLLEVLTIKFRAIVLFLSSSGCRIGALTSMRVKDLKKVGNLYRVTVYIGSREEYITFISPEASKQLEEYWHDREMAGEKIEPDSLVFRDSYARLSGEMTEARAIRPNTVIIHLGKYCEQVGIRKRSTDRNKRQAVMQTHGFRKFFTTQCLEAGVDPIKVDRLLGHRSSLLQVSYYRPDEKTLLEQYKKAIPFLSINDATVLKIENEELKAANNTITDLQGTVAKMQKTLDEILLSHFKE